MTKSYLYIDTTQKNKIILGYYDQQLYLEEYENAKHSEELLRYLEDFLAQKQINIRAIKGILVNGGPGSYTGTRIGITTANSLAWTLNVPVISFKDGDFNQALKQIQKFDSFKNVALPFYKEKTL